MKKKKDCRIRIGKNGGPISAKDNGEPFGKIIAKMVLPGNSAHMKWPEAKPGAGVKMALEEWQIIDYILCMSVSLWNTRDPILKERYFGLGGNEGNHGEDVKELYYFLDATPTHSYLKMLYKYPAA